MSEKWILAVLHKTKFTDQPTFTEAMNGPDKNKFLDAIHKEYSALIKNNTFSNTMD